jgi:hypothetical protein
MYMTSDNSLIQIRISAEHRSQELSTPSLRQWLVPLCTMIAGAGTEWFGSQIGLGALAA